MENQGLLLCVISLLFILIGHFLRRDEEADDKFLREERRKREIAKLMGREN